MIGELIHVTRWDNQHKEFVNVGLLCESDGLEKPFPIVSFTYSPGYLDRYEPMYPKSLQRVDSSTLINDADFNAAIPKAFAPFLPNNTMKNVLSQLIVGFNDMTPFQQLNAVTSIKGDFGAIQLNYDNDNQWNVLPKTIDEAARLLSIMHEKCYGELTNADINAVYDYDKNNAAVRMVCTNADDTYYVASVSKASSQREAEQARIIQSLMVKSGVNALEVKVEEHDGDYYILQYDANEIISPNRAETFINDAMSIHPILRSTKYIADEANICAAELSNLCKSIAGQKSAKEFFTRSVIAQILNQRDFNINQVKFKNSDKKLTLAPQRINPIVLNDNQPFQLPLVSGQSNHVSYPFQPESTPLLARAFGISSRQQSQIIDRINDTFSSIGEIAKSIGVENSVANSIEKIHEKSGLFKLPTTPTPAPEIPDINL